MPELLAALTDLAPVDGDAVDAPRLPALEALLARGRRRAAPPDWRRWALRELGGEPPPGDLAVGASVATAAGLPAGGTWLLATPVHLHATLTHLRLHAAGPLPLDPAAAAALAARFAAELAEPGVTMHAVGARLLVHFARTLDLVTHDPAPYAGRDVGPAQPTGADAGLLRRLSTEIQMWLHGRSAARAEQLPVNALWLWGAGTRVPEGLRWPRLEADDPLLESLHVRDGRRVDRDDVQLVGWRLASLGEHGDAFGAADARWFAPLARALAMRRVTRARVWFAGHEYELTPLTRLRFWTKSRPWWELAA